MIRLAESVTPADLGIPIRAKRRQMLRMLFLGGTALGLAELAGVFLPFFKVGRISGLGAKVSVGNKASVLARFEASSDEPILNAPGRFFLLHPPGGIVAAYRKCTHLGCTVPWVAAEDQFHCPCHGSLFEKRTGVVRGGPAPRPLDLFHLAEDAAGALVVDTNPLNLIVRSSNDWDPADLEVKA